MRAIGGAGYAPGSGGSSAGAWEYVGLSDEVASMYETGDALSQQRCCRSQADVGCGVAPCGITASLNLVPVPLVKAVATHVREHLDFREAHCLWK